MGEDSGNPAGEDASRGAGATPPTSPPVPTEPSGPRRRLPTAARAALHLVFGAVLPVICVLLDPIVFTSDLGPVRDDTPYCYALIGTQVLLLVTWVLAGRRIRPLGPVFGGALAVGALFALALGIVLLPISILGLVVVIGVLGFTPFATAWVFFRRSVEAFRVGPRRPLALPCAAGLLGAALAIGAAWGIGSWAHVGWRGLQTNRLWQLVDGALPESDGGIRSVVHFDGRLWCIGNRLGSSPDGKTWSPVDRPAGLGRALGARVALGRLWILGRVGASDSRGESPPALWSTADGRTWAQAAPRVPWRYKAAPVMLEYRDRMWALCGVRQDESSVYGISSSEVWASTTGADWQLVSAAVPWGGIAPQLGAVLGGRMWVAEVDDRGRHASRLWSSSDGLQWAAADPPPPWAPRRDFAAEVGGGALWVLGGERQVSRDSEYLLADIWCSPDGVRWIQISRAAPWGRRAGMTAVSDDDRLWLLGGHDGATLHQEVWVFYIPFAYLGRLGAEIPHVPTD